MHDFRSRNFTLRKIMLFLPMLMLFGYSGVKATHIVGAELYYECLNSNTDQYRVTLRLLRDCLTGQAPFDDEISLFIFPVASPGNYSIETIPRPVNTPLIEPEAWDSCVASLYNLCIEEAFYQKIINLPKRTGGYYLGWARCCRNQNITNLAFPLSQGVSFLARVPGPEEAICNNMPSFNNQMPVFICADEDFYFDHSATDPDGDSLVYSLSMPFDGLNLMGFGAGNPNYGGPSPVVNAVNPMGPPPYRGVNHDFGFSATFPFGFASTANIHPVTGFLHFNPSNPGVYVIAISVKEYRDGVLLSENKRDFQIHAVNCRELNPPPVISHDLTGLVSSNDTIFVQAREPFCYRVTVEDSIQTDSLEAWAISPQFGNNNPTPPNATISFSGRNPLFADICWEPSCNVIGQTIDLILSARDHYDCPYYNNVFDTVYVTILPPPPVYPSIGRDFGALNYNGDTLTVGVDTSFCFDWWVVDTSQSSGNLAYSYQVRALDGGPPITPNVSPFTFPDSLPLAFCWTPTCDSRGHLYRIILTGTDESGCPPANFTRDTVFLRIPELPNPPPVISHDLTGNILNGDTILIDVHDTLCYAVTINDTFPAALSYATFIDALDNGPAGGPGISVTELVNQDSIVLQVCWSPVCDNVDRTFRIRVRGSQLNKCNMTRDVFDTVYVRVQAVQNPPPLISHSFLPGYDVFGDTIRIAADSTACYNFSIEDTSGTNTFLAYDFQSYLLPVGDTSGHSATISLTSQSNALIAGEVCIAPGCEFVGEQLMLVITGRDTFDCDNANWVYDTVFLDIVPPDNQPPQIQHFLNGLEVSNGVVQSIPQADSYCYEIELYDPDPNAPALTAEGISRIFDLNWRYGNSAEISYSGTNPLIIEVCWAPSCYDSENEFELIVCGRDTSRCGLTPEVCDTVRFFVESCSLEVENVFTPNGDGFNETFVPYEVQGVDYYDMVIYDRWGRTMFEGSDQGWDGNLNGAPVAEGVYYYVLEFQFFSARGVPLKETKVGWVTLLR